MYSILLFKRDAFIDLLFAFSSQANIVQLSTELNDKMVTCAELEDRVEQLPIEANKALSKLQNELEANKMRCQEQQRLTDQAEKELELSRNEINTLKTLMEERERSHITLTGEHQKMTARLVELVDINEHYAKELAETNLKHSEDMKKQAYKHEVSPIKKISRHFLILFQSFLNHFDRPPFVS